MMILRIDFKFSIYVFNVNKYKNEKKNENKKKLKSIQHTYNIIILINFCISN